MFKKFWNKIFPFILLVIAITFMIIGVKKGEHIDVYQKAIII